MNTVKFTGNVGQEVRITNLDNGKIVANFTLATTEKYQDKDGNEMSNTQWHNIVAWGKTAEKVKQAVRKGSFITLTAKAQSRKFMKQHTVTVKSKEIPCEIETTVTEYNAYELIVMR
jgi:single-strand DNA-binding protein